MSALEKDSIYNLKVVLQETGIKPDTLRAWERRYGLPQPARSEGGHRLYSEYDIEMIRWLMARQKEGMRINRAMELWKSLESEGRLPLEKNSHAAVSETLSPLHVSGDTLFAMRQTWIDACLAFDEQAAEHILAQAFARYPLESVCLEVLRGGLSEIGSLWYSGRATVQQEHFASALAIRKLSSMIAASPTPYRLEIILVACPPEEKHVFAPMLITLFLRYQGWNVVYLGADVPLANLEKAVDATRADLILLNATMLYTAANLYDVSLMVGSRNAAIAYGGNIFTRLPVLRQRIPGFFLGEQLDHVTRFVDKFLTSPVLIPAVEPPPEIHLAAVNQILDHQHQIEAQIWESLKGSGISISSLEIANEFLGKNIVGALKLGNIEYLKPEIDWVAALIRNHGFPVAMLPEYLSSYAEAVNMYLPMHAHLVADFLKEESQQLMRV